MGRRLRLGLWLLAWTGCEDLSSRREAAARLEAAVDASRPADLSHRADAARPADLAVPVADMAVALPEDLAAPAVADLATPVPDLSSWTPADLTPPMIQQNGQCIAAPLAACDHVKQDCCGPMLCWGKCYPLDGGGVDCRYQCRVPDGWPCHSDDECQNPAACRNLVDGAGTCW